MLVNCAAYQDGRRIADIVPTEIHDYLKRPGCFVWVAIKDPSPAELDAMQEEFGLHDLAVEDARHGHQQPKLEEYGQSLFAVLHMLERKEQDLIVGEVAIFVGANHILTVRRGVEKGFRDVRTRCEDEPDLLRRGTGYVFYALMDAVVDRYFPVLDALSTEIEELEQRIFSSQAARANIEAVYVLKQKLTVLKHAIGPLVEASSKLHGGRVPPVCGGMPEYFRDIYDHVLRLNQAVDGLRDTLTTAITVNLSLLTIQENEVTKRLAAYAALVAVPTMIAGLYGMNFRNMPELEWSYGYPLVISSMTAIDLYLFSRFRKAKWL